MDASAYQRAHDFMQKTAAVRIWLRQFHGDRVYAFSIVMFLHKTEGFELEAAMSIVQEVGVAEGWLKP